VIWWWALSAFAGTLEIRGGKEPPSVHEAEELADVPLTVTAVDGGWRVETPGGWISLDGEHGRSYLRLDPEQDAVLAKGRFSGEGAAELQLLYDVGAHVHALPDTTKAAAAANGASVRAFVAARPVSAAVDTRAVDLGLAMLAGAAADTAGSELFEDDRWYFDLRDALQLPATVADSPPFWHFGWSYGRQAGGVKKFGAAAAVDRIYARTDEISRHAVLHGTVYWALESAQTPEHLDGAEAALAKWKAWGAPPEMIDRYGLWLSRRRATMPGAVPPEWTGVVDADAREATLAAWRGKPVVVDFWGTWCGPCLAAIPDMAELARTYEGRVQFVAVAQEEPGGAAKWKAAVKKRGWGAPTVHLYTESRALGESWSVVKYPTYAILDAEGRIVAFVDDKAEITPHLEAILQGG
jgi:thiol-disulfide isomerase/thioredoxin